MTHFKVFAGLLTLIVLTAGCGLLARPPLQSSPSIVMGSGTNTGRVLTPSDVRSAIASPPNTTATTIADLTGSGSDRITVQTSATGDGTAAVANAAGRMLWTKPHVAGVYVLEFGRRHLPVLLTQGSAAYCGTGGCQYQGYTWNRSAQKFVAVSSPTLSAYHFLAKSRRFRQVDWPGEGGLFGFVRRQGNHLVLVNRLYDEWQHVVVDRLTYRTGPGVAGSLLTSGPARYEPQKGHPVASLNTPFTVVQAYLEARSLSLPRQARQLVDRQKVSAVWSATRSVADLGPTLYTLQMNPAVVHHGDISTMKFTVVGEVTGVDASNPDMAAYGVNVSLKSAGSTYRITHVVVTPVNLKLSTADAVLKLLARDPKFRSQARQYRGYATVVEPIGAHWQVFFQNLNQHGQPNSIKPFATYYAETGKTGSPAG